MWSGGNLKREFFFFFLVGVGDGGNVVRMSYDMGDKPAVCLFLRHLAPQISFGSIMNGNWIRGGFRTDQ